MTGNLILTLSLFLAGNVCFSRVVIQEEKSIRVAVFQGLTDFDLTVRGRFTVTNLKAEKVLEQGNNLRDEKVQASQDGIRIGPRLYAAERLSIAPQYDAAIYVQNRRLRGDVNILRGKDDRLTIVNVVNIEEYVKGVLFHEVSPRWPLEAVKAQAVATRTYALYRMQFSKDKDFDVTDDIYSQVYGGKDSERYRTNLAVMRTRDKVLVYNGKILPAYFHATCAGHTEDAGELWKEDMSSLKGVECSFCRHSPHYNWKRDFRSKDVQDKLNASGYTLGLIKEIKVLERNPSGRIRTLQILTRDGKTTTISGKDFRNTIGPNEIRSNNYAVVMKGYYFDLIGHGWGHGVGLCQWGAMGMAQQHRLYDEILAFYYPGSKLVDNRKMGL